ncbi:MAG: DUF349 domain-containing protein [Sporichthyaceae bacterium]|nr:DUF349 domain-containing protein [Sporichthyaceae bacterium]
MTPQEAKVTSEPWGRVDEDGTVYVRTATGERVVGSWQAGSPDEALAFYRRKYEGLELEVNLLEHRIKETDLSPKEATASIERVRTAIDGAAAVGDLDSLLQRLDGLVEVVEVRRVEYRAARAQAQDEAKATKERIVAEAEEIAASTNWRVGAERLRVLVADWKNTARIDRKTDDELWHRLSRARSSFSKRRKAHFATLEVERDEARTRKEKIVAEAESLAGSTEWANTAARFRALMAEWKAAGRAGRDVEDALWTQFRAAQEVFFTARGDALAERDAGLRENLARKEELVTEAEALLPVTDPRSARAALRSIHDRWEAIGHVPREARGRIESRLAAVEQAVRETAEAEWRRTNPEARARAEDTVSQLRASIEALDAEAGKARAAGNTRAAETAEEAATARREWLAEAENTLAEFTR